MIRRATGPAQLVLVAAAIAACAGVGPQVRKLSDGSFQIACDRTLASCLEAFENVCDWHGYDVISATERRGRTDLPDVPNETVKSEARVRCKPGEPLFGGSPKTASSPGAPAAPLAAAPTAPAPTVEPPAAPAASGSCNVPAADGGAPACDGASGGGTSVHPAEPR